MRRIAVLLLVFVVPAPAEEAAAAPEASESARIELAKKAMETHIKLGDLLRQKGDLDGARRAYEKAVRVYEEARRGWGAAAKPKVGIGAGAGGLIGRGGGKRPEREAAPAGRALKAVPGAQREAAIRGALRWLAKHQDLDTDGKWDCDDFMKHDAADDRSRGRGGALHDVGASSLAILAFLGAGHTDRGANKENPYAKNVRMGLRFLMSSQADDGCFGTRATHSFIYNHAMATLAMCEAYRITQNPRYKKPAFNGVAFLLNARNPYLAWRYEPRGGENDTSVTSWCVLALKSARSAGLIDAKETAKVMKGAVRWVDKMTDPDFGQVGYNYPGGTVARPQGRQDRFPPENSQAMTAAGILIRVHGGQNPDKSEPIRKGVRLCIKTEPRWDPEAGTIDPYYWFIGTLAMFHVGGRSWRRWNAALADAVVPRQQTKGGAAGSWDPVGPWGEDGGRVVSTALTAMSLQLAQRYGRTIR